MLTKIGVKLLDFGLAKLKKVEGPLSDTTMVKGTASGTLLGTMPYMAPEQVEGRSADARSDIFSLGAVIYEMVTEQRAFKGDSPASVIGAILKDEPLAIRRRYRPRAAMDQTNQCGFRDPATGSRTSIALDYRRRCRSCRSPGSCGRCSSHAEGDAGG